MPDIFYTRVKICTDLGKTEGGGSSSRYMASDDGVQYVIKFKENTQSVRVLINELVANKIANLLKLPCPDGVIAELDEEFLAISDLRQKFGKHISAGTHFGVRAISNKYRQPPRNLIKDAKNKDVFPKIVLFDILTLNSNRNNDGNFLIVQPAGDSFDFYIIDHGHCFGSPNWDTSIVNGVGTWNQNVMGEVAECITGAEPFKQAIEEIKSLNDEVISALVDGVPDEWQITRDEREALKTFLKGQRDKIDEIIMRYKQLFPNWK